MAGLFKRAVVVKEEKKWIKGIQLIIPRKLAAYDFELICWEELSDPDPETELIDVTIRIMGQDLKKVEGMVEVFQNDLGAVPLLEEAM